MRDIQKLSESFFVSVKDYVATQLRGIADRLTALEARAPERGEKGEKGDPGADAVPPTGEVVRSYLEAMIPDPIKGDTGERGEKGDTGDPGADASPPDADAIRSYLHDVLRELPIKGEPGERGDKGDAGEKGERGLDGVNGKDAAPLTAEEVRAVYADLFKSEVAGWALEFERRATDLIQRTLDRIEKPKDGAPGKDGRDGIDLSSFDLKMADDERTLTLSFMAGEQRFEKSILLQHPIYRGTFATGKDYRAGDVVTWGGSGFVATRDTKSKPEIDDSWRLFVKRGRDGKDGAKGEKGEAGKNGKDFSYLGADR